MTMRVEAGRVAQDLLNRVFPGAIAVLAGESPLPRFAEWAALELHVFHVPQGMNTACVKLLLAELHRAPFSEDDALLIYPHSTDATREHYSHVAPGPRGTGARA